jgi:hypothetical protein
MLYINRHKVDSSINGEAVSERYLSQRFGAKKQKIFNFTYNIFQFTGWLMRSKTAAAGRGSPETAGYNANKEPMCLTNPYKS